ncbi:MAG: SRPBCC family protein [Nocardioidaceae bacterium]
MATTTRVLSCSPRAVFGVLSDGWLYASWVVGASRIRDIDGHWPSVGASIHHSVGSWPLMLDDNTEVEEMEPDRLLQIRARAWPAGEARVRIELDERREGCEVTINEDAIAGPALLVPQAVRAVVLRWRNTESLRRLAYLAEHGARPGT